MDPCHESVASVADDSRKLAVPQIALSPAVFVAHEKTSLYFAAREGERMNHSQQRLQLLIGLRRGLQKRIIGRKLPLLHPGLHPCR